MNAITITSDSEKHLDQIQSLWRKNSATLGFFPDGAFIEHSKAKKIIVAIDSKIVIGYLLYRVASGRVAIVHLCVIDEYRSKGVARKLFNELSTIAAPYMGITLKCRRDFPASKLWPRLGFTASGEVIGRSAEQHLLTIWKRDNGHPDLFTDQISSLISEKICVVIDANVFYGLLTNDDKEDEESKVLTSDWLPDSVELFLTDEILNEINRNENHVEREQHRRYIGQFSFVPTNISEYDETLASLIKITKIPRTPSHESDMRQLCKSICGGMKYFVTRDERILKHSDQVFEQFNLLIMRPTDLIIHLDEMMNKSEYEPFRLSGTRFQLRPLKSGEQDRIASEFINTARERKSDLLQKIRTLIAGLEAKCFVCFSDKEKPEFIVAYHEISPGILQVPIARIANSKLSKTITRHLALQIKTEAVRRKCHLVKISDTCLSDEMKGILLEESFYFVNECFYKVVIQKSEVSSSIQSRIKDLNSEFPDLDFLPKISEAIEQSMASRSEQNLVKCEKAIWPGKILDANIETYIIPIRPNFARELFDVELANADLFGSSDLILNRELVYYRSARPYVLSFPARILWYVSMDKKFANSGYIRACSYLDDIHINAPKILFRKFKRLGVYKWPDLVKTAKNNLETEIMAIRFSETELAKNPIAWRRLQQFMSEVGSTNTLTSPVKISNELFSTLYMHGFNNEKY